MKVGILTFHRADNFGAVLQSYALQTYLQKQGYNVKIIDYRCFDIECVYHLLNPQILFSNINLLKNIYLYIKQFLFFKEKWHKVREYDKFRKLYLNMTRPYFSIKEKLSFDIYITGSDQVWNYRLLHGYNPIYFLNFPVENQSKRVSYAVSSDVGAIDDFEKYKNQLINDLQKFNHISVREEQLKEALSRYIDYNICVCCDPTFLLEKEEYINLSIDIKRNNYIFVYHMAESTEASLIAEQLAKEHQLDIIEYHARFDNRCNKKRHLQHLGPREILGYINNAEYVITTSFHGLALSIILEKQFIVVNKYGNVRLLNLLSKFNLQERLVNSHDNLPKSHIDYSEVKNYKESFIFDSKEFLRVSVQI